ncbi:hypothetical protein SCAR479_10387 [Seiridium cardinale]|uniref:Uncharacterized protein n=1 Tax=Seiridium cardinale TaxID=138064 RepID=A0ABR2XGJ9_9PEZI
MTTQALVRDILKDLPEDAAPRASWPGSDPRKQTAIERRCFEDGATIHFDRLPTLQFWAPLVARDMATRTGFVVTNTVRLAAEANLKLTQSEIDCISYTCAKNYRRMAWSGPLAVFIAGGAVYHGRETFRFPFYTPKGSRFNPHSFPTTGWAFVRGTPAVFYWHGLRLAAYYPLILLATTSLYGSIVRMSIAADTFTDPRMSRINQAIMNKIAPNRAARSRRESQSQSQGQAATGQPIDQSEAERRDESYRRVGLSPPSSEEVQRMAQRRTSETASTAQQDEQFSGEWSSESPSQADRPLLRRGFFGRATPEVSRQSSGNESTSEGRSTQPQQSTLWNDSELFEDDASPVSAAAKRAERAQTRGSTAASSWENVRQQAKSDVSPFARGDHSKRDTPWGRLQQDAAATERDRERTPPSENYSYNEADEAKDYAKSQAQKEFDTMLEAERKGSNDSSGKWR